MHGVAIASAGVGIAKVGGGTARGGVDIAGGGVGVERGGGVRGIEGGGIGKGRARRAARQEDERGDSCADADVVVSLPLRPRKLAHS